MNAAEARRRTDAQRLADVADVIDAGRRQEIVAIIADRADRGSTWVHQTLSGDEALWLTLLRYDVKLLRNGQDLYLVEW